MPLTRVFVNARHVSQRLHRQFRLSVETISRASSWRTGVARSKRMEGIRSALAASIAARALAALLGLLALPIYLRFLGVEAYGVVGLFATLQVLVAFMDLGLATTLTRHLAGLPLDRSSLPEARDVALTFEWPYLALAFVIGLLLAGASPLIASNWVKLESLTVEDVSWSLQLAALSLACSWPTNLYGAGLAGRHRQIPLAVSTSAFAALRVVLAVLFIWRSPTLDAFFWAQVVASVLQSAGTRLQLWRELALTGHRAGMRWSILARSRRFAGGMTAITITSILLVQMDKLILSHLLTLADFGVYVIAGSLAGGLYILISPVFSIIYPRISVLWSARDVAATAELYHTGSQAIAALILPIAAVLMCFPALSLFVLTDDSALSENAKWVLVFLVIGAVCNGVMNIPYALQLAAGWTSLSVWLNLAAVAVLAPATWWAATRYGANGGAAIWALLNVGYLVLTPQFLHRRLLPREKWRWYREDVLIPAATSLAAALLLATIGPMAPGSRWLGALQLAGCWLLTAALTLASLGRLRTLAARIIWR